jgi:O-antigen/teichoic acid export membrane protein
MSTRTSRAVKGTITGIIQSALAILFQLIITPMILIHAGQEALGGYAIIMQIIGYGILLDFGFYVALTRYLCQSFDTHENENRFGKLLTVGRNVLFITNFTVFLLLLAAALNIETIVRDSAAIQSQAQQALCFMAIWMVARTPLYIYNAALTATQNMATLNIIAVVVNLIRLLAAVALTYWGFGLLGLVMSNILAELTQFAVQRAYFRRNYPIYSVRWEKGDITLGKEMLHFGVGYWGVNLSVVLLLGSDNIIVGALYGAATASVFYSTKMFGSLVIQFISRIIDNTYPALNELIGKNDHVAARGVYLRMLRYILLVSIPSALGIVLFTGTLVTLWIGEKQYAGSVMAVSLSLFVFVQVMSHLHGMMTLALGKLRHWSTVSIGSGLLSIALGYSMGKGLGMQWILFGMTLAMLPVLALLVHRVIQQLDIKATDVSANVLPGVYACVPLLAILGITNIVAETPTLMNVAMMLMLYFLLWIAGAWTLGLNSSERLQLRSILSRTFQRA